MCYALCMVLAVIVLNSCGNEPPVFNNPKNPFIVGEIVQKNKTHSIYYKNEMSTNGSSYFGSWFEAVILPDGMYNIGDTVIIAPNYR